MTLTFTKSKETKHTWQFQEQIAAGVTDRPVVGTLYMTKEALAGMGWPHTLKVEITVGA